MLQYELKEIDLNRECPRDIRDDIAMKLGADWEGIGLSLYFSLDKLKDITRENSGNQEMCRVSLLDAWSKREGKGATILKLARVLHRRERRDLVEFLCARLRLECLNFVLPLPENVTGIHSVASKEYQTGSLSQSRSIGQSHSYSIIIDNI